MKENRFKEINRSSLSRSIVEQIKSLILRGEFQPGDKLPPERELTQLFKVSRIPLREAIKVLEQMGLVIVRPSEGIYISQPTTEELIEPLISNIILDKKDNFYLIEVRRIIEISSVVLSIDRASEKNLENMEAAIENSKRFINDSERFANEDLNFHIELIKATNNPVLLKLIYTIRNLLFTEIKNNQMKKGVKEDSIRLHTKIFEAIIKKDKNGAVTALDEHFKMMDSLFKLTSVVAKLKKD